MIADNNEPGKYFGQWWVLSESHDAHLVNRWEMHFSFTPIGPRLYASCNIDITPAIEHGFQAKGVVISCDYVQAIGACLSCLVHFVRDIHYGEYNLKLMGYPCPDDHPCEIDKLHYKLVDDGILV